MTGPLDKDLAEYWRLVPTLTASEGKFALIRNGALVEIFDTYADALAAGYKLAGLQTFLVKRIASQEFVAYFTREVDGACRI